MANLFVTGTNRGLGLELVRQYLSDAGYRIFATARQPEDAPELQALATDYPERLMVLPLDTTNPAQIESVAEAVRTQVDTIDLLINNAGFNPKGKAQTLDYIDAETMIKTFRVNVVGTLLVTRALIDLLRNARAAKVVNFTSHMGSLTDKGYGGYYAYCASKAALNMVTRALAADLRTDGIVTICMHPGWVQTDMGGPYAQLTPQEAVQHIRELIAGLSHADIGEFYNWDGTKLPW